jgi:hypothetical protein
VAGTPTLACIGGDIIALAPQARAHVLAGLVAIGIRLSISVRVHTFAALPFVT